MPYAILSVLWLSVLGLLLAAAAGMGIFGPSNWLLVHVSTSLSGTLLALFAHTMTLFYFIGSGTKIKEFIATWEEPIRKEIRQKTIVMKNRLFPWMMLVGGAIMVTFILGGATDARLITGRAHAYCAYATLILHAHVVALETIYIFRNIVLIDQINLEARKH